jgi:molybdate/tungstate transport system substrate-binding protein
MTHLRLLPLLAALLASGCHSRTELVVFHASSLSRVLSDLAEELEREAPDLRVHLEPSGSQVAARKITELGMRADLVAVADAALIDRMLLPSHARFNAVFATNEMVLAHKGHSRFTEEVTSENWPEVVLRAGVRLGRASPDLAPIGYHTLFVWQLAERSGRYGKDGERLEARLRERCGERATTDEAELLSLLESKAIDYAFLYRSTAEDHRLKITPLPAELNLSSPELAPRYASAAVEVAMKQAEARTRLTGSPVTYGLTIPAAAPHPAAALRLAAFILGERGQRALRRAGFRPVAPATCAQWGEAPLALRPLLLSPR